MNNTTKKMWVRYYIPEDCSQEVSAEIRLKLATFNRNQLETLICFLSQEVVRLEQKLTSHSLVYVNSEKHIVNSDSHTVPNNTKEAAPEMSCERIFESISSMTKFDINMPEEKQRQRDIVTSEPDINIDSIQSNNSFVSINRDKKLSPDRADIMLPVCNDHSTHNNKLEHSDINDTCKLTKQFSSIRTQEIPVETVQCKEQQSLFCMICQLEFPSKINLNHHMRTAHKYAPYSCMFCAKSFTYNHNLKVHQRNRHNRKTVLCSYCGKLVLHTRLDAHMEKVHEKPVFTCHICQKGFLKRECLEGHINKHSNKKPYICECCGRKYTYSTSLCSHRKQCVKSSVTAHLHHSRSLDNREMSYICEICGVKFEGVSGLKDHFSAKHSNKSQNCSFCGKSFQWRPSYNRHVKKCKDRTELERERCKQLLCQKSAGKQFVCVCGKQYPYRQSFRRHERNCRHKQEVVSYMNGPVIN